MSRKGVETFEPRHPELLTPKNGPLFRPKNVPPKPNGYRLNRLTLSDLIRRWTTALWPRCPRDEMSLGHLCKYLHLFHGFQETL